MSMHILESKCQDAGPMRILLMHAILVYFKSHLKMKSLCDCEGNSQSMQCLKPTLRTCQIILHNIQPNQYDAYTHIL